MDRWDSARTYRVHEAADHLLVLFVDPEQEAKRW